MEEQKPAYLVISEALANHAEWKQALDSVTVALRSFLLFDNMALYLGQDGQINRTDVVYARATGRGKSAEADIDWGQEIAQAVFHKDELIIKTPDATTPRDQRISFPYFLGLPLKSSQGIIGALVFVRFGGPTYTSRHINDARYLATLFGCMFERRMLEQQIVTLEESRRQADLQEDFIATISHELRTPLGFIKGYSTTLLRPDAEWDAETRKEFLTIIDEEADHLAGLIDHMLESARLQSKTLLMNFQPVRIDALLRDATMRSQTRYKDLTVILENETQVIPLVMADSVRLTQVLLNFFSNAVKYAPGSPIYLRVRLFENFLRIEFRDEGPGIAAQHLPHIFNKFYRVPGYGASGSGLGLFICRLIILAHRGQLAVQSMLGQGTTFLIDLPLSQSS